MLCLFPCSLFILQMYGIHNTFHVHGVFNLSKLNMGEKVRRSLELYKKYRLGSPANEPNLRVWKKQEETAH